MNLKANKYHKDLLNDTKRLDVFEKAINSTYTEKNDLALDLGCGSGILSIYASKHYKKILAYEIDENIIKYTKENIKPYKNIELIKTNLINYNYKNLKPDLIICEMLDTALIDEEQVKILNNIPYEIKNKAKLIPCSVINKIEAINMKNTNIVYEDNEYKPQHQILSKTQIYDKLNFKEPIKEKFDKNIILTINKDSELNGIKITTETILTPEIKTQPTPMLNPKLLIPLNEEIEVKNNDKIKINLKYTMGEGLETIKTKIMEGV